MVERGRLHFMQLGNLACLETVVCAHKLDAAVRVMDETGAYFHDTESLISYRDSPCGECLQPEVERLQTALITFQADNQWQAREILRLRAALAEYANEANWWIPEPDDYFPSFKPDADTPWLLAQETLKPSH